jgi:hypothetical protein
LEIIVFKTFGVLSPIRSLIQVLCSLSSVALTSALLFCPIAAIAQNQTPPQPWSGFVRNTAGEPIDGATLQLTGKGPKITATTNAQGVFRIEHLPQGTYRVTVKTSGHAAALAQPVELPSKAPIADVTFDGQSELALKEHVAEAASTGGEQLSSKAVSELPLNKRDFSQLLLLAAGTMTDANGSTNFTQQFAINGQRGVEATFAMDGADISDPEMGGATLSNFNVDAVQEIQSNSGWMPAEIGRGASGFTNIITRSGLAGFHGSVFEFVRNSAFDARNYFDHPSIANPGRIPPFRRNEFGFTNGGPIVLPGIYDGRGKTFYFGQYQGFRQVLGTTQVISVPTVDERAGFDSSAYPGDTLKVAVVDPQIEKVLARYPMPNNPTGPFGRHSYATSSKVVTNADQFSIRFDHRLSDKAQLLFRFNFDNLTGPTTNPSQTAIDPSFGIQYVDQQRNGMLSYTRTVSPRFGFQSTISFTRSTPSFPTPNRTDPGLAFGDSFFEPFNLAAGSVMEAFGNLFQAQQDFTFTTAKHAWKFGAEARINRDTTYFGIDPNNEYTFGGGTAYSPVAITSNSGQHNIAPGDPLPDALTGLLTASAFTYTSAIAPTYFSSGAHIGPAAISRNGAGFFFQDTWKISPRFVLDYGLRYELYTPISERAKRTASFRSVTGPTGPTLEYVLNPQPGYRFKLDGFGPRVRLDWKAPKGIEVTIGGAIATIPPNIWQDNFLTGSTPLVINPRFTAAPGTFIPYGFQITPAQLPRAYTPAGVDIYAAAGSTKRVPANTVLDVTRYERDMAALTSNPQITPLNLSGVATKFGDGYLDTWSLTLDRHFGSLDANAAYIGTAGVKLPAMDFPNGYAGADPAFAPLTEFNAQGQVIGGFGTETLMNDRSHSTYHALQTSISGTAFRGGPGIQASYTWSKAIDDTSGVISAPPPQNPFDTRAEKGPASFDTTHVFTMSLAQEFHLESLEWLQPVTRKLTAGWQMLSISTITSGSPFTIYSGVQQTGVGSQGVDRPDQIAKPKLTTTRKVREDYFGLGEQNASFFSIPINLPGGTGPNQGRFGTLGRNTFRGPAYYDYDFAFIKNTPFGHRGGGELMDLQFRTELFNLFNIVNFGAPANAVRGAGFGEISRTAGTSRQIQFSLKLIY